MSFEIRIEINAHGHERAVSSSNAINDVKKSVSIRKKKDPPPNLCGVLDKFFDSVTELGVAGIRKLYKEQLAVYRAPDYLYKFDVVCLDHSRVVLTLESPPCTNYIHANWVRFENLDRVFIATQDLEDTNRIVPYFPPKPGGFANYGRMFVNTKKLEDEAKFLVYTLEILPDGCSNSLLVKLIKTKSDPGKSPSTTVMLKMLRVVSSAQLVSAGPVVVHCVSGVGRALTIILIDAILQRLLFSHLPVDIGVLVEMFKHLRNQRASSLQRDTQFLFVVASVVDYIGTRYPGRYRKKRDKFKEDYQNSICMPGLRRNG
ncbi:unnamed protein product [Angiostrongylus costaricensis]|uniref:Protein-tyrosine phosphatase n=1 Tax=Angiostrongylus costaricensis TaxID=334426 RepID=A0A158PH18_ANGCS|nr:unnamed protein product [Angiostrongylus costaricensis]